MKRNLAGLLGLAAAVLLAPVAPARADGDLTVPVILPLTGLGAFLGQQEQVALDIMQGLVNRQGGIAGRPLRFEVVDDRSVPQDSVQLMTSILARKPNIVLGSAIVAACGATAPLVKNGPVQYCFSPAIHPAPGSFVFTSGVSSSDTYRVIVRYFRLRGWTRIAYIASTDASGQDAEKATEEALTLPENAGVTMAARTHFNPSDVSVSAQMEAIRAANPQALMLLTSGTPSATVFKGMVQAGLDVPAASPYSNMTFAQMDAYAGFLPKDLYFPSGQWPQGGGKGEDPAVTQVKRDFYDAYKEAGRAPDVGATLAWDPALVAIAALRKAGPDASAETLRTTIAGMTGFAGLNGLYDFRANPQRGLDESDVVMARWEPGRRAWIVVSQPTGIPINP